MQVQLLTPESEIDPVAEILLQLRPKYSLKQIKAQIRKQQQNGYQLACVVDGDRALCVAGFTVGERLAWGKHIYIDDLVSDESCRSAGAGRTLVEWLKNHAKEIGCGQVHLDSGVQRFAAHRFYLRAGFDIASHHFSIAEL